MTRKNHHHNQDQNNHQEVGERLDDVESLCNLLAFLQRSCNTAGGGTLDKARILRAFWTKVIYITQQVRQCEGT